MNDILQHYGSIVWGSGIGAVGFGVQGLGLRVPDANLSVGYKVV